MCFEMQAAFKKVTLKFKQPMGTSRGALSSRDIYIITISDSKYCGVGECAPLPGLSYDDFALLQNKIEEVCAEISVGKTPEELDLSTFPALRFGIEMAWLDFTNRGQQIFFQTEFTESRQNIPIHGLIKMGSTESMFSQIEKKIEQGFRCIKLKIGALDFDAEIAFLNEFRKRYSEETFELRLDANGAFSPEEALEKIKQLAQFNVCFLEQPIQAGNRDALAQICLDSPIPIALDEELIGNYTFDEKCRMIEKVRPDVLILKPTLLGGIAASEEWIRAAKEFSVGYLVNSMLESNFGLNYLAQWTSTLSTNLINGLGTGQLFEKNFSSLLQLQGDSINYAPQRQKYRNIDEIILS